MSGWRCSISSVAAALLVAGCGSSDEVTKEHPPAGEVSETVPAELGDDELAGWLIDRARYAEALPVVERVVAVRREGGEALPIAESLMTLGMVRDALGEPSKALPSLAEAWELFGANGAPSATMGACADGLGLAAHGAKNYEDAEHALLAAIEYRQQASPDDPEPWVSASRMHLGRLYLTMARYEEAEELLSLALESARGNAAISARARQLGSYHHTIGAYRKATALFDRALDAAVREHGAKSAEVAAVLGDLGLARLRSGDLTGARAALKESHELIANLDGAHEDLLDVSAENLATFYLFVGEAENALPLLGEPDDAVGFNNLGSALQLTGEFDNAGECFERARSLAEAELEPHHPLRIQILQNLACNHFDRSAETEALDIAREAGGAAVELLDHLLKFGTEAQRLEFRRTSDPLSLLCSFGASPREISKMIRATKGVVLNSLLSDRGVSDTWIDVERGNGFVDTCVYQHYLGRGLWEPRYGAVMERSGHGEWIELGRASQLESLLEELRKHVDAAASGEESGSLLAPQAVLRGLYDFCIRPLGELPSGLIYSPDGDLRFVPFAALHDGEQFFCERPLQFRLVPSAKLQKPSDPATGGWAMCSVEDYSGPAPSTLNQELRARIASLGDLPGVKEERDRLNKVKPFRSLPADKAGLLDALRTGQQPEVLHFSSHGIFLGDGERPLARSCLVLEDKQPLFPAEIAQLPLAGTRLVTLSACDTGLGVNMAGEGVLGLQRGFLMAGADHILMTLWAVGDRELPEIMADFYSRLSELDDPPAALWSLQRERLPALVESEGIARAVWIAGGFTMLGR